MGRVRGAKTEAKIDFGKLFFDVFFECVFVSIFGWIFGDSNLEKSRKTIVFSMFFVNFHEIDVFKKSSKKESMLAPFRETKATKIQ